AVQVDERLVELGQRQVSPAVPGHHPGVHEHEGASGHGARTLLPPAPPAGDRPARDGRRVRSGPVSPTVVILLVLLASIAISLGLAALIVRQGRAKADRALADLGARRLTAVATALGTNADA